MSARREKLKRALQRLARSLKRATLSLGKAVVTWALIALIRGWLLMLAVGVAHHDWTARIPPMGYWTAVLLTALYPIAASTMTTKRGES